MIAVEMMTKKTANFGGTVGSAIIMLFWIMLLTPFGRSHGFPRDIVVIKAVVSLAFIGCAIAAFKGSRWWWIAFVVSLGTAILVVVIAPV
jgi:hypothetical protein